MARIVLGVTGSVAAIRTTTLWHTLSELHHRVRVVATDPALYFFDREALDHAAGRKVVFRNQDEWPNEQYRRGDGVLHIELREWADLLAIAPLDANTLAKIALGIADNLVSCLVRCWDPQKPIILAPAMNTRMWESPVTVRHFRQILDDWGDGKHPQHFTLHELPELFARHAPRILIVPPQCKRLACGDVGMGAMAEVATIAESIRAWSEDAHDE
jgi:phosphopantothenoylcysteine decarboxylase